MTRLVAAQRLGRRSEAISDLEELLVLEPMNKQVCMISQPCP